MYDLKWIRENPETFDEGLKRRGLPELSGKIIEMDKKYRSTLTKLQEFQQARNEMSQEIGNRKKNGEDASALMEKVGHIKEDMAALEKEAEKVHGEMVHILERTPNTLLPDVIFGKGEEDNKVIRKHLEPTKFDFEPKEHDELGVALGQMDFEQAAVISGSRFTFLKGDLARLERALGQFMLDLHTKKHGFSEVSGPVLVHANAVYGVSQLPKFEDDLFKTNTGHYLISTSEVSLTNLASGKVFDEEELPIRMTSLTPCFRSEAGAAGKDTKGMLRQHQFWKVEMVVLTTPEKSTEENEYMTSCAEKVLQKLEIPYQVLMLCSGDMGFGSARTYDIEAWLPGQNKYREISSCSVCGDFQAIRMNARYKKKGEKGTHYIHTLNGSGLAVGRTLIAVMENYQQADGSIKVPDVLIPYMGGVELIEPIKK